MSPLYEKLLLVKGISTNICAYRRNIGTNIHIAETVFSFIKRTQNCLCLAFDIERFFDNIDHEYLKEQICGLLHQPKLPKDFYAIFKSITKYSYIELDNLPKDEKGKLSRPVCKPTELRQLKANGLLKTHAQNYGIPQGTQISAFLSNLYMVNFDSEIAKFVTNLSGLYKRYADDILIIIPAEDDSLKLSIIEKVKLELQKIGNRIKLNDSKTECCFFINGKIVPEFSNKKYIQYLGFIYDGTNVLLRPSSLSRYWRKMVGGIRRKLNIAKKDKLQRGVFKTSLYHNYSHLGKKNNFFSYIRRATGIFYNNFSQNNKIKSQTRHHM